MSKNGISKKVMIYILSALIGLPIKVSAGKPQQQIYQERIEAGDSKERARMYSRAISKGYSEEQASGYSEEQVSGYAEVCNQEDNDFRLDKYIKAISKGMSVEEAKEYIDVCIRAKEENCNNLELVFISK